MNRIDRLSAILIQLQTRRLTKAADIAERFEISLRTVYRDIRALEQAGVPIGVESGKGYYLVKGYHLPPVMFTQEEASALLMGGKLVDKFSDKSIQRSFNDALYKIKAVLGALEKDHLEALNDHIEVLASAKQEKEHSQNHFLAQVQSAVGNQTVLKIDYTSFSKDELTTRLIEPIGLCFYAAHWHLIAFCRLRNDYRDFRVDRIRNLTVVGITYSSQSHPSLQNLIQKIVSPDTLKPATVRFAQKAAKYIHEQRYYFGFVSEEQRDDGYVDMNFMVASMSYFARWLLSFLDDIQIVKPSALDAIMQTYSKRLYEHYLAAKKKNQT